MNRIFLGHLPTDLGDGICGALIRLDNDYIRDAWNAAQIYLGEDTLASQSQKQNGDLGFSKIFELVSKPELALALIVVAREMDPAFSLFDENRESLEMREQIARIEKRFPAMSANRIERALNAELMQVTPL